jgi:hypothetical protein
MSASAAACMDGARAAISASLLAASASNLARAPA